MNIAVDWDLKHQFKHTKQMSLHKQELFALDYTQLGCLFFLSQIKDLKWISKAGLVLFEGIMTMQGINYHSNFIIKTRGPMVL